MKKLLSLIASAVLASCGTVAHAQTPAAGSVGLQIKNSGTGSATVWAPPPAGTSGTIVRDAGTWKQVGIGAGLSITGGNLVATATGGTWGTITGTLSAQTDLQAALNAKADDSDLTAYLTTAAAATSYQPKNTALDTFAANGNAYYLNRANHTGTQVWGTITGTPTTLAGYGIADGITAAAAAAAYQPLDPELTAWAAKAAPSGAVVGTTDVQTLTNKSIDAGQLTGTLAAARLPTPGVTTLGGVKRNTGSAGQYVSGIDTDGSLQFATPSGAGTVTSVGLSLPAIFTVTNSPVTSSGTLTGTLANQSANLVWAGPASGPAAAPTFRSLATADLPVTVVLTSGSYADPAWITSLAKSKVGLSNVENTALSTWTGSANLTTLGTITAGTWTGSAIGDAYISSAATWNAKAPTTAPTFTGKVTINKSGSSEAGGFEVVDDPLNPTVRALYILPPDNGSRIFFGKSGQSAYSVNLSNVSTIEGAPAFDTQSLLRLGGVASFAIDRNSEAMRFNATSPTGGGFWWYASGSAYESTWAAANVVGRLGNLGARTFELFESWTDDSNYAGAELSTAGSRYHLKPKAAGTGTLRPVDYFLTDTLAISSGSGSPEGVLTRPPGSVYLRTDGGPGAVMYLKETGTGNTGWLDYGGGDMLRDTYDPRGLDYITGRTYSTDGGVLNMDAGVTGDATMTLNNSGGSVLTYGGVADGSGGEFGTEEGTGGAGGSIETFGGAAFADITGAWDGGAGGFIRTYGGAASSGTPGKSGGSIDTSDGGGSINTRGTGSIQLGSNGTRTTLNGAAGSNWTLTLPTGPGSSGQILTTNGTGATSWTTGGAGSVTSVAVSGGSTGLTTSGGPITISGTITLGGVLAITNGGTGSTDAAGARTSLGLAIGTNVQAWDADLDTWAAKAAPSGAVVGTTDVQTLTNKSLDAGQLTGTLAAARLPDSGAAAGTYASVTVDAKGRVTAGGDTRAAFPPGHLQGLALSNNASDAANDIDIAAGSARDSADVANLVLASAITKRLDASWTVGNGGGGLDTGSKAVSTWYALHLIRRPDTGVVDVLFSTSGTAPTMPANYTQRRRLGWVRTDGTGALTPFFQAGNEFFWKDYPLDYSASMPTTATLISLSVPPQEVIALIRVSLGSSATHVPLISSPSETDRAPNTSYNDAVGGDAYGGGRNQKRVLTNSSGQVRGRSTNSSGVAIHTFGWTDLR